MNIKNAQNLIIHILIIGYANLSFSQTKDCKGQFSLAEDYYINGDFKESANILEKYKECEGTATSNYYKLIAEIFIANDELSKAKHSISLYINSKAGNYISDSDPEMFKDLFYQVQDSLSERLITSVSKKPEDVDFAAATVIVIKENEFNTRGYNDLIDLLSDLPGFDISKIQSAFYANIFQRGFRQENTERTLLLIDGIEENDIWSNVAYISRQYPLSNISAVEIIYGPASTIYGARAFAGAINIITKSAKSDGSLSFVNLKSNPMNFGVSAKTLIGSYNSKGCDLNITGKNKEIAFTLTGRVFSTGGNNLNSESFYDYKKEDIDNLFYDSNKLKSLTYNDNNSTVVNELDNLVDRFGLIVGNDTNKYFTGYGSGTLKINSDSVYSLINKARKIDKDNYLKKVNGSNIAYSNNAYNYFFSGKISLNHFTAGFRTWKNHEGFNYYQDLYEAGSKNGNVWAPKNSTFYVKYDRQFKNVAITNSSSYVISSIDKESALVNYNSFYGLLTQNSYSNLSFINILFPDSLIDGNKQGWRNTYYYYKARQFRNDFKFNYSGSRLNVITGLDIRSSQLQGDYLQYKMYATDQVVDQSKIALAEELGTAYNQENGGNQYNTLDLGLYSQASYKLVDSLLYITLGGRYDYNRIRTNGGFGGIFNPKFAIVYSLRKIIIKGIYAQGIQNASQFTKYSTFTTRNANPDLKPERIKNFEFVIQNRHGNKIYFDVSGFYSIIDNAISSSIDKDDPKKQKNQNSGVYQIFGAQGNLQFSLYKTGLTFNFNSTFTAPRQTENKLDSNFVIKTIGDISAIKANLISNYHKIFLSHDLNFNLRCNYIGNKPVGESTTVPLNKGVNSTNKIPEYLLLSFTTIYKNLNFSYITFQFTINNLLNSKYYSPGPRTANGNYTNSYSGYVPYIPQQGRNFIFTINMNL